MNSGLLLNPLRQPAEGLCLRREVLNKQQTFSFPIKEIYQRLFFAWYKKIYDNKESKQKSSASRCFA